MEDIHEGVGSGFEMEVNAPYSLNYLIFVQNIYLNNHMKNKGNPLFPYLDSSTWGIVKEDFEKTYKKLWQKAVHNNSQSGLYDHNGIFDFDQALYQKLFEGNEKGKFGYAESVKSFLAWWEGIYGKIAIEKVFDDDRMNKVYRELSATLKVNKRLKIDLIYDKQSLTEQAQRSWYSVLPIEDIFNQKRSSEIVSNLLKSCEGG